jgi:hypothetical protein
MASLFLLLIQLTFTPSDAEIVAVPALVALRPVLPRNIDVPDKLRLTFERLLEHSPTLTRQCRRIGAARHVRVVIRMAGQAAALPRARSTITRYEAGALLAEVDLPISRDLIELLAHELEHVIEQIEGVKLADLVREGEGRAYRDAGGVYETQRAMLAGQMAAAEMRQHTMLMAATTRRH